MNKMDSLFTIFPTLILMYAIFYFMQSFVGKKQIYGVSVNQEYNKHDEFLKLDKNFKKFLSLGFISVSILTLILVFIFDKTELSISISTSIFLIYEAILYIKTHKIARKLKDKIYSDSEELNLNSKLIVDMSFISEKNKIIKKFKILYIIPLILTLGICTLILLRYQQLPNIISTNWTITGKPSVLLEKSYFTIFKVVATEVGVMLLLYIVSIGCIKSRVKVDTNKIEESKSQNIKYLNKIGYLFFILILTMSIQFYLIYLSWITNGTNAIFSMSIGIIMILNIVYLVITYIKSPNLKPSSSYTPEDNEKYWILGMIYNNPNDPSFMVDKKFGIGWTVNFGNPLGKIAYIAIVVALILGFISVIKSLLL